MNVQIDRNDLRKQNSYTLILSRFLFFEILASVVWMNLCEIDISSNATFSILQ